jgi:hypothetical protein
MSDKLDPELNGEGKHLQLVRRLVAYLRHTEGNASHSGIDQT